MRHRNKYFIFIVGLMLTLLSVKSYATTLKSFAMKSNLLLVMADDDILRNQCSFSPEKISELSQKLKDTVDQKIENLSKSDFAILDQRLSSCEANCTCTVYAYAYEVRGKDFSGFEKKAKKETLKQRKKCALEIKNICEFATSIND